MQRTALFSSLLTLVLALAGAGPVQADQIKLKNGRSLEGRILKEAASYVRIATKGGKVKIPRSMIKSVVKVESKRAEFVKRRAEIDAEDLEGLAKLAVWASKNGLGEEAKELNAQVRDQRLKGRVAKAKVSGKPGDFVRTFHWARRAGVGRTVQLYLLEQAKALDPAYPELRTAFNQMREELRQELERLKKLEEIMKRPHFINPLEPTRTGTTYSQRVSMKAALASRRSKKTRLQEVGDQRAKVTKLQVTLSRVAPESPEEKALRERAKFRPN
jgi:hypothetical protein